MISCPKCQAPLAPEQGFCEQCGTQLKDGAQRLVAMPREGLSPLHRKHLRGARVAIMFVAVVTVAASGILWYVMESQIESVSAVDQDAVATARLAIVSTLLVGLLFFGMFFWAKTNPFGASLTALIVYLTSIGVGLAVDPESLAQGIILKVIIIVALVRGVQSGLAFKQLEKVGTNPE